jgi:hypothetical protein
VNRNKLQGVRQILSFHWQIYVAAIAAASCLVLAAPQAMWAAAPALFWLAASVAVSHYIYDRSPLYTLDWMRACLPVEPRVWAQFHAGLDETSGAIAARFPHAAGSSFDVFDAREMTESSIRRARQLAGARSPRADWRALPLRDAACDAAFVIFTAHEFRNPETRARFFREIARTLHGAGDLIVVEHLRDWRNFLAFGPGFWHFLPERAWLEAAAEGGFVIRRKLRVTPFVRVFAMRKI